MGHRAFGLGRGDLLEGGAGLLVHHVVQKPESSVERRLDRLGARNPKVHAAEHLPAGNDRMVAVHGRIVRLNARCATGGTRGYQTGEEGDGATCQACHDSLLKSVGCDRRKHLRRCWGE